MNLPMRANGWAVVGSLHCSEPGAPVWVDLGTTAGTTTAARFYCSLFGWRVLARHRPLEDPVGYWVFHDDGNPVGGLAPAGEAGWSMYLRVTDVDVTARAVTDNGGTVLAGPTTAADSGRVAVCTDPLGATFVLFQPDHDGYDDQPGQPDGRVRRDQPRRPQHTDRAAPRPAGDSDKSARYRLACREPEVAIQFYGSVFGWGATTTRLANGSTYTQFFCPGAGQSIAGMVEIDDRWGDDVPAHWITDFAVANTDRTAARAAALGGTVSVAPFDLPNVGRIAVLKDPESALFSVLQAA